jgi:hypothetical protein
MNGLLYLVAMSVKNALLELPRKPAKLILYIIVIAGIIGLAVLSTVTRANETIFLDIAWLEGIFFLLILMFAVISVQKGLSNGDAIFGMDDVNLLFVSPTDSRPILLYGVVRMTKTALWTGFIILFQSNTLAATFNLGFGGVLLLVFGAVLALILLFVLSLIIYSATNGRPARKRAVKAIFVAFLLPLAIHGLTRLAGAGDMQSALLELIHSPFFAWTPVAGWSSAGAVALLEGDAVRALLFLGLIVLTIAVLIAYIALSNPDYYEDVLVAAETSFEKKRNLAEGRVGVAMSSARKIKVAGTGISGVGARVFFFKHLRESFRTNRFGLLSLRSVLIVIGAGLIAALMKGESLLWIMQVLMWLQIFMIGTGQGMKELFTHYIYMIPEASFPKIVWSNLEIAFTALIESVLIFGVVCAASGESPLLACASVAAYTLFSLLLIGVNYLSLRWTGADIGVGLLMFLYVIAVILITLPGIILAVFASALIGAPYGNSAGVAVLAVWEGVAALICFALSKGALNTCDMPAVKKV